MGPSSRSKEYFSPSFTYLRPAVFTADQSVAQSLVGLGSDCVDPVWPLPLYKGYEATLKSEIADLSSTGSMPLGGAITAALFLQHFIGQQTLWMHLDGGAYNMQAKPGRPKGGEAMGLRTLFAFIQDRYLS